MQIAARGRAPVGSLRGAKRLLLLPLYGTTYVLLLDAPRAARPAAYLNICRPEALLP